MSWTAPYEWTAGEVVTAAKLNEQLYYNMRYLKGIDSVVTVESGLVIDNTGGDEYLKLPLLTTGECTSVLNAEGEVAFDETTHRMKFYDNNSIVSVVGTDDVDDSPANGATTDPISSNWAYDFNALLTTRGDIIYASGTSTWARLAKGAEGTVLRMGANDPAWGSSIATHEFMVPVLNGTEQQTKGDFPTYKIDVATENVYFAFKCPHDFSTLTSAKVIGIKSTNGTVDWTATTDFAAVGEAYTTHSDSATADTLAMTDTEIEEIDISAAFTGLLADDYVGCKVVFDAISAGDYDVIGLTIKYS